MAVLDPTQIVKLIQETPQNPEIKYCKHHDRRALFHTEPTEEQKELKYLKHYLAYIQQIIDDNKFNVFEHIVKLLPIETVDFTEGVFNELKKVKEYGYVNLTANQIKLKNQSPSFYIYTSLFIKILRQR